jgi:YggT family protein
VTIICFALQLYFFVLLARIIFSWIEAFSRNPSEGLRPVMRVVYDLTEPVMGPVRRVIPPIGGLDISPIFIFIALGVIRSSLCG